ncbi:hypothetical protein KAS08_03435 [Candidatus Pacearchaeota archaeon]|nr:hypothetical protein [Candidatus Pacearchaeota archaeon]
MIKNKRGQIFSLWMVPIAIVMMGAVIGLFYVNQHSIHNSVVSPMNILNERDALEIFEGKEVVLIINSLESSVGDFGSDEFHDSFRRNFVAGVFGDDYMKEFLFSNLSIDGVEIMERSKDISLIENGIYPRIKSEFIEGEFIFVRNKISKNYFMRVKDSTRVNFPLGFNYEFERKYLIKKIGDKFSVVKL